MVTFKHKNTKKFLISTTKTTTLDNKHNEFVNEFNNNNSNKIPLLIKNRDSLKKKFNTGVKEETLSVEEILDLKEEIKQLNKEIKNIKKKEKDYYLTNSNIIFDYFEDKKNLSEGNNKLTCVDNFFNINKDTTDKKETKNNNYVNKYLINIDDSFINVDNYI